MFHFDKDFGLFIGKLSHNTIHKHYALQISVSEYSNMTLTVKSENIILGKAFFINSKVEHKLISDDNQLTILINPISSIGHKLYLKYEILNYSILNDHLSYALIDILKKFENREVDFKSLCVLITEVLTQYKCSPDSGNHLQDDRVARAIQLMDTNFDEVLSLKEVSAYCHLSPTRFLHLFKEKTGLNFRRYQLWNKVVKSLPYLIKNSITDTAFSYGFSDSSHYTRTFIETFGVTPKFFLLKK